MKLWQQWEHENACRSLTAPGRCYRPRKGSPCSQVRCASCPWAVSRHVGSLSYDERASRSSRQLALAYDVTSRSNVVLPTIKFGPLAETQNSVASRRLARSSTGPKPTAHDYRSPVIMADFPFSLSKAFLRGVRVCHGMLWETMAEAPRGLYNGGDCTTSEGTRAPAGMLGRLIPWNAHGRGK